MKLYLLRGCPFAHRASFVLGEKQLAFEPVIFELASRPPELDAVSPHAKSPTLFDGEVRVWDSQIVIDYLEDRTPEPALLPKDAAGRAEIRMLLSRVSSEYGSKQGTFVVEAIIKPEAQRDPARIDAARREVIAAMAPWDRQLAGKEFLGRGVLTQADIALYTLIAGFVRFSGEAIPDDLGNLRSWHDRLSARPASKIVAV